MASRERLTIRSYSLLGQSPNAQSNSAGESIPPGALRSFSMTSGITSHSGASIRHQNTSIITKALSGEWLEMPRHKNLQLPTRDRRDLNFIGEAQKDGKAVLADLPLVLISVEGSFFE
jgi:hypothetical protein